MATVNRVVERGCSMLVHFDRATSAVELKEALETGSAEEKADHDEEGDLALAEGRSIAGVHHHRAVRAPERGSHGAEAVVANMETIEKCGRMEDFTGMILLCQSLRNNDASDEFSYAGARFDSCVGSPSTICSSR